MELWPVPTTQGQHTFLEPRKQKAGDDQDLVTQLCLTPATTWTAAHQTPLSTGSPRQEIMEWVAIFLSRGSSRPRDRNRVSCIAVQFSSVESLRHVQLFATPWTAAHQASLSVTNSRSLLKLMSIESVMPSNHLILCHPLHLLPSILPRIRVFPMSQFFLTGGQSIGASASVLPMNIQD